VALCPDYRFYLNCSASAGVMLKFQYKGSVFILTLTPSLVNSLHFLTSPCVLH
jgi:hypothetical protein